jgi:hypothetical protein
VGGLKAWFFRAPAGCGRDRGRAFGFNRRWEKVWAVMGGRDGPDVVERCGLITRQRRVRNPPKSLGTAHAIERLDCF